MIWPVKIDPSLAPALKASARARGMTVLEYITDLVAADAARAISEGESSSPPVRSSGQQLDAKYG